MFSFKSFAIATLFVAAACHRARRTPDLVDAASAVRELPPCPHLRIDSPALRRSVDSTADKTQAQLVVLVHPAKARALVDAPDFPTIGPSLTDTAGLARIALPTTAPVVLRIRSIGFQTTYYRLHARPGFEDSLVVVLQACV